MLDAFRAAVALLYALLMSADAYMELSGRYARVNIRLEAFPYYEGNRTVQSCVWSAGHACIAYLSMHEWFYVFGVLYFAMAAAGALALRRLRRALRPDPAATQ